MLWTKKLEIQSWSQCYKSVDNVKSVLMIEPIKFVFLSAYNAKHTSQTLDVEDHVLDTQKTLGEYFFKYKIQETLDFQKEFSKNIYNNKKYICFFT